MRKSIWLTASIAVVALFLGSLYFAVANGDTAAFKITVNYADGSKTVSDPHSLIFKLPFASIVKDSKTVTSVMVELQMKASWKGPEEDTTISGRVTYSINGVEKKSTLIADRYISSGELITIYTETLSVATIEGWDAGLGAKVLLISGDVGFSVDYPDGIKSSKGAIVETEWSYVVEAPAPTPSPSPTPTPTPDPSPTPSPTPQNNPPIAEANSPYEGKVNVAIDFSSAGSSDSDGSIDSYKWNFGDGSSSTSANPSHVYASAGVYTITLTVKDNDGATSVSSSKTTVTASDPIINQPPVADANGPYSGNTGTVISFSSSGSSDSDGSIVSYKWTFGDWGSSTLANPTHKYLLAGLYTVKLTVKDNDGYSASGTTYALITNPNTDPEPPPANEPPIADVNGPYTGITGKIVYFWSSGSYDPDGSIVSYKWTFGDGGSSTSNVPTHKYTSSGTYTVKLTVTDNDGAKVSTSTQAVIEDAPTVNQPPHAECNGPYTAQVFWSVWFTSAGTYDPDGHIASYHWAFGDGRTSSSHSPPHAYNQVGTYTVTLTVTDNDGAIDVDTTTVRITIDDPDNPGMMDSIIRFVSFTNKLTILTP